MALNPISIPFSITVGPVAANTLGTLWSACGIAQYGTVEFVFTQNSGGTVQMQSTLDVDGAAAGTAVWLPNSDGQPIVNPHAPQDATTSVPVIWPIFNSCSRLQVIHPGTVDIYGSLKLGGTLPSKWAQSWPNQNLVVIPVAGLPAASTQIIAFNPGVRQVVIGQNVSTGLNPPKVYCTDDNSAAGNGVGRLLEAGKRPQVFSLIGFAVNAQQYGGPVSRRSVHCFSSPAGANLTFAYQGGT